MYVSIKISNPALKWAVFTFKKNCNKLHLPSTVLK